MTVQQLIEYLSNIPRDYQVLTPDSDNKDYTEFSADKNIAILHFNKSILIGSV